MNYSIGFASDIGDNWSLTADYYRIEVSDRIYRVGDIPIVADVITSISLYTNALYVAHLGIDLVLNRNSADHTEFPFAYACNQVAGE